MKLFDNPGTKIKIVAIILFFVNTLSCIFIAAYLLSKTSDNFPLFISIIILGPVVFWLFSLILYGFGHLIESAQITEIKLDDVYAVIYDANTNNINGNNLLLEETETNYNK